MFCTLCSAQNCSAPTFVLHKVLHTLAAHLAPGHLDQAWCCLTSLTSLLPDNSKLLNQPSSIIPSSSKLTSKVFHSGPKSPIIENIQDLPDEILISIFSLLNLADILVISMVCRKWNHLSTDQQIWLNLFKHTWPMNFESPKTHFLLSKYTILEKPIIMPRQLSWKSAFRYKTSLEQRFIKGLQTQNCWKNPFGIASIAKVGSKIVVGGFDPRLVVWDPSSVLNQFHSNSEVSQHKFLSGHTDWIKCVVSIPNSKSFVSVSSDKSIRFWNLNHDQSMRVLSHVPLDTQHISLPGDHITYCCSVSGNSLICGNSNGTIEVFDIETGQIKTSFYTQPRHQDPVQISALTSDSADFVVTGNREGIVSLYDLRFPNQHSARTSNSDSQINRDFTPNTGIPLYLTKPHTSSISAIAVDSKTGKIFTGSRDKVITSLDLRLFSRSPVYSHIKIYRTWCDNISSSSTSAATNLSATISSADTTNLHPFSFIPSPSKPMTLVSLCGNHLSSAVYPITDHVVPGQSPVLSKYSFSPPALISQLYFDNSKLIAAATSGCVSIWNLRSDAFQSNNRTSTRSRNHTIRFPQTTLSFSGRIPVTSMIVDSELLYIADNDGLIRILNFSPPEIQGRSVNSKLITDEILRLV